MEREVLVLLITEQSFLFCLHYLKTDYQNVGSDSARHARHDAPCDALCALVVRPELHFYHDSTYTMTYEANLFPNRL
jgi:hypothetical protein